MKKKMTKEQKRYNIKVPKNMYYYTCINIVAVSYKLSGNEKNIVALLNHYHNKFKRLSDDDDDKLHMLFSTPVRKAIRDAIGLEEGNFNNYIGKLKKKNVIIKKGDNFTLNPRLMFPEPGNIDICFTINTTTGESK